MTQKETIFGQETLSVTCGVKVFAMMKIR